MRQLLGQFLRCCRETSRAPSASWRSRKMARGARARRLQPCRLGNVTTQCRSSPVIVPDKFKINYESATVRRRLTNLIDVPAFPGDSPTDELRREGTSRQADRVRPRRNPGKLRYGHPSAPAAIRTTTWRSSPSARGDLDMIANPTQQGGRVRGVINDMLTGDTQAAFLNVAFDRPAQVPAPARSQPICGRQSSAPAGLSRTCRPCRRSAFPGRRHHRLETPCFAARRHAQARARDAAQRPPSPPLAAPARQGTRWHKQKLQHIVPSKSVDEAKTWLAGEIGAWKKITSEVKIEKNRGVIAPYPSCSTAPPPPTPPQPLANASRGEGERRDRRTSSRGSAGCAPPPPANTKTCAVGRGRGVVGGQTPGIRANTCPSIL